MRTEEETESTPRSSSNAAGNKGKKKKKATSHNHIGPNVRAFRAGLAFCPSCDADKLLRLTESERESEKVANAARETRRR